MHTADFITRCIDLFYLPPIARLVPRQTFRYAACGGFTYLLLNPLLYFVVYNFVIDRRYIDLRWVVMSPHIAALVIVFPIVFFTGFWLNKHITFRQSTVRTPTQILRYTLSVGGSILMTYLLMKFFVEVCGIWPTPANVATTVITTVYSYLAAKYFTFRHAKE